MFAGINMFLARLRLILAPTQAHFTTFSGLGRFGRILEKLTRKQKYTFSICMIGQHDGNTAPIFVHFAITGQIQQRIERAFNFRQYYRIISIKSPGGLIFSDPFEGGGGGTY